MKKDFSKIKYGSFLIIPLKFQEEPDELTLNTLCDAHDIFTMDINPNVKSLFCTESEPTVGKCYHLHDDYLYNALNTKNKTLCVRSNGSDYEWCFRDSFLYLFHTKVAFLCLGIGYKNIEALEAINNPGFAVNTAEFFCDCKQRKFSLCDLLSGFLDSVNLSQFFDSGSILLDCYVYNLALFPKRFDTLEEMEKLSFNLHQMIPLDFDMDDSSEQDVNYVYAVRDYEHNSYRWGCCITSQTISYVVADPQMNFDEEWTAQSEDGLPMVILSLYQKYTCLRFNQLITDPQSESTKTIKKLKSLMLEFKVFGTVAPENLSRWDNVRQIYRYLLDVNGVNGAISDIDDKLSILSSRQDEIEQKRNNAVVNIITIFGIVSILESVLSIVQILSGAGGLIWVSMIVTSVLLAVAIILVFYLKFD